MKSDTSILALDLGSTRFKAGKLAAEDHWDWLQSVEAPALQGGGLVRAGDPTAYVRAATEVMRQPDGSDWTGSLGLTSQRSTFLLWRRDNGLPVTRLISWQDRRAAVWCDQHQEYQADLSRRTGLRLTPHYVGPKVAQLRRQQPELARQLDRGDLLLGTLETYLIWSWSGGRVHATDVTMAARTMLMDLEDRTWHPVLLELFGVPRSALPQIRPTVGQRDELGPGRTLVASVADQAAGLFASVGGREDSILINLGTGGFVLAPVGDQPVWLPGYLCGPCLADERRTRFALEGTINGAGAAVDRFPADGAEEFAECGSQAFCFPDVEGAGAPYWRADHSLILSSAAQDQSPARQRQVVIEGLLFRILDIVEDLVPVSGATRFVVTGGLANDPMVRQGLAALLPGPLRMLDDPESTLRGAAWLADGRSTVQPRWSEPVSPTSHEAVLREKYPRWRQWVRNELGLRKVSER